MPTGTHDALPDSRNEEVQVWINGSLLPRPEARISVFDSGYLVGDGIWEGLRLHQGKLLFLEQHLDRLFHGLTRVGIDAGLSRSALTQAIYDTAQANRMFGGVHCRIMVTRGIKKTPSQDPRLTVGGANVVVIAEHKKANPTVKRQGVALHLASVRRPPPDTLDQRLNCHSKLHEVMALNEALAAGADEALMLDTNGNVATCNATNFFAVVSGQLWTSTGMHCLPGITRANVLAIASRFGLTVRELDFAPERLEDASEAFVTGSFGGLTPVNRIGTQTLEPGGPVTRQLSDGYDMAIAEY
ncbi:MAG: aminotransferase class IV, partial [Rhodothermales bacterium]|nr:aminotransferase class IV [Rhodothermales bacterium]